MKPKYSKNALFSATKNGMEKANIEAKAMSKLPWGPGTYRCINLSLYKRHLLRMEMHTFLGARKHADLREQVECCVVHRWIIAVGFRIK